MPVNAPMPDLAAAASDTWIDYAKPSASMAPYHARSESTRENSRSQSSTTCASFLRHDRLA